MKGRVGMLFMILLGAAWASDARELVISDAELNRKSDVCALCEEYTAEVLDYLNDKEIQREIIDHLHNTCNHVLSFKEQCIELVDQYASHFFSEIASVQPGELCKQIYLCESTNFSSQVHGNDTCDSCKDTVLVLLAKLNDPETKLEILEALLKACNSMEKYAKKVLTRKMKPVFNLVVQPQEGRWTHNETSEMGTFIGSVQLLISPIASDCTPQPILPLTLPIHLTLPLIPGYTWVGMNLPSADSVDRPVTLPPTSGEIPLSAYPPYDPATGCGFLLPGVPIEWSTALREETPSVSREDAPAIPSPPVGYIPVIAESEEEEDPSEGSPC